MTATKGFMSRNNLIIHTGSLLFFTKAFFSLVIFSMSLLLFNVLYLWCSWIVVSLMMDSLVFCVKPKFLFDFTLTEKETIRCRITSNEMKKYLQFVPMIRFCRTLLMSLLVIAFFPKADWDTHLLTSLTIGFLMVDPIMSKILNIKTPTIFNKIPSNEPMVSVDVHRYNPAYIGSAAWNAFESTRSIKK